MVFSSHTCSDTQISRLSKHVPVPINMHHFPIHITQEDCRTQSWTQGVLTLAFTCMLCIEGTWCRYVHGWLATRILSQKREPWELDSCGLHWNKKKRSRWVTHNCKSYNASPHTNFVLQATNMKGLGTRLVNTFITRAAEVEASESLSRSPREVV